MKILSFSTQKIGEDEKSNQDAFVFDARNNIFAVSDGVSRSSFSDIWSKKLVQQFIQNPFNSQKIEDVFLENWLNSAKSELDSEISKINVNPMILDVAKENGSAATFLGCKINKNKKHRRISIWALGDTNIFQICNNKIVNLFPIKKLDDFGYQTFAISTFLKKQKVEFLYDEWIVRQGDIILMATDAFSKWFLNSYEIGQKPWKKIIKNHSKLNFFIENLRFNNKLENDDTTFILIQF